MTVCKLAVLVKDSLNKGSTDWFDAVCCSTEIVAGFVRPSPRCAGSASRHVP